MNFQRQFMNMSIKLYVAFTRHLNYKKDKKLAINYKNVILAKC